MKVTPFNQNKFKDLTDKIEFYEREGTPEPVREWAEARKQMFVIERQKNLTDRDIRSQLEMLFRRIDPEILTDEETDRYAELMLKYDF